MRFRIPLLTATIRQRKHVMHQDSQGGMIMAYRERIGCAAVFLASMLLYACGGGGGGGGGGSSVNQGVFLDSAVEGLRFETETQEGFTNSEGMFRYRDGETVSFHIGGILLGSSTGAPVLTPINLVPGANSVDHPHVTNIIRFLQTLDEDATPDNGIRIPSSVFEALLDQDLDFDREIAEFENDSEVVGLISNLSETYLGGARVLVAAVAAQTHLAQTLARLEDDGGSGEAEGSLAIAGADTVTIGTTFTPSGPVFPFFSGTISSIQWNEARPDFTAIGIGAAFFPGTDPYGLTLDWQSQNAGNRSYGLSCNPINSSLPEGDDVNCSRMVADFDNKLIHFNGIVLEPRGAIGSPISLTGTLGY